MPRRRVHLVFILLMALHPGRAAAELDREAAVQLFVDAMADEKQQRFEEALTKFRRVQQEYKDTVNVRYRIGACLEGLGKLATALASYESVRDLAARDPSPDTTDTVKAALERATALDKRVPRLSLTLSPHASPDAEVKVDDAVISREAMRAALPVDPGRHAILATAKDVPPFQTTVTLPEGGQLAVVIFLDPPVAAPSSSDAGAPVRPPPPVVTVDSGKRTAGWLTIGASVLLVGGSVTSYVLGHHDITTLKTACNGDTCPLSRQSELNTVHNRAVLEEGLGVGLGVAGVCAALAGIYLVATSTSTQPATKAGVRVVPVVSRDGAQIGAVGVF
jgi:hypothetical protein